MMAHLLTLSFPSELSNLLAALSSALAAFFWYRASQVEGPSALLGTSGLRSAADSSGMDTLVNTGPLIEFAQESGRRNKIAALWSAAAALFAFLGWALGTWLSWTSGGN